MSHDSRVELRRQRQRGWPFWLAVTASFACLTLGTVTILGKNIANAFSVPGSTEFETVEPATIANLTAQVLLIVLVSVVARIKPAWRAAVFVTASLTAFALFVGFNAWAESSVPHG